MVSFMIRDSNKATAPSPGKPDISPFQYHVSFRGLKGSQNATPWVGRNLQNLKSLAALLENESYFVVKFREWDSVGNFLLSNDVFCKYKWNFSCLLSKIRMTDLWMVSDLQFFLDKKKTLRSLARVRETDDIMVDNWGRVQPIFDQSLCNPLTFGW